VNTTGCLEHHLHGTSQICDKWLKFSSAETAKAADWAPFTYLVIFSEQ